MMAIFFLKSATCLLVLLLFYRYVLQREAMYQVNRFYLLAAVVVSFLIPLYTIEVKQEAFPLGQTVAVESTASTNLSGPENNVVTSEKKMDWPLVFISLYLTISAILLLRFVLNIRSLLHKVNNNQSIIYRDKKLILLKETCSPFSFLDYIFVAQADFDSGKITDAVWTHESTHVREKHSWDNIFIEFLLVILWFHPVLYWAKEAIKLNHEFIADQAALKVIPLENYKLELLSMIMSGHVVSLTSSLNFSLTRKRLAMMKVKSTGKNKWLILMAVLPMLGGLIYFLSEKAIAQVPKEKRTWVTYGSAGEVKSDVQLILLANGIVKFEKRDYQASEIGTAIRNKLQDDIKVVQIYVAQGTPMGFIGDLQSEFRDLGISINFVQSDQQKSLDVEPKRSSKYFYYSQTTFYDEDQNGNRIKKSFNELSEVQKLGLPEPPKVPVKIIIEPETFETWKNAKQFAVWVDGINVPNQKLDRLEASQIVYSFSSFVHDNARSQKYPQPYQVNLYTEKGFENAFGPNSIFFKYPMGGTMTFKVGK